MGSALEPRSPAPLPCPYLFPAHVPRWVCLTGAAGHSSTIANRFSLSPRTETPEGSSSRAVPGPECSPAGESGLHPTARPPGPLTGQRIRHNQNGFPLQMRLFLKTAIAAGGRGPVVSSQWPLGTAVSPVPYGWCAGHLLTSKALRPQAASPEVKSPRVPVSLLLSLPLSLSPSSRSLFLFL